MGRSDWTTGAIELVVRSALLESGFRQHTAVDEGFTVSTLFADVLRAGEGVVAIAHVPSAQATLEQISAYRAALETHPVSRSLWIRVVPVGPLPEYRLWTGFGVRVWRDGEEEPNIEKAS